MKVFLQREGGEFSNISYLTAWLGFKEFGYEIEFFEWKEIDQLPLAQEHIVTGGIPAVMRCLQRLSIPLPELSNMPAELTPFAGRKFWWGTLADARQRTTETSIEPFFMKPQPSDRKLFNGQVVRCFRDLLPTAGLPAETPIFGSEIVNFESEYRVFVLRGEVVGCKHYKGDFRRMIDFQTVDSAIAAFHSAPVAYGIDFGITDIGRTVLVEVNDSYSFGCYGLGPTRYAAMIESRWNEMVSMKAA